MRRGYGTAFDSVHVAIIGVVDLGGNAANGRLAIAHHAKKKAGLLIEIQRGVNAVRASALHHVDQPVLPNSHGFIFFHGLAGRRRQIADGGRHAHAPIRKNALDLSGKGKLCVQLRAIQLAAGQLVFAENGQWCAQPGFVAVEGSDAVAAFRLFWKDDGRGALIREFRDDLDLSSLSKATEAHAGTGGHVAFHLGRQALSPSDCLDVLVEDFLGGRLALRLDEDVIHILRDRAVHVLHRRRG